MQKILLKKDYETIKQGLEESEGKLNEKQTELEEKFAETKKYETQMVEDFNKKYGSGILNVENGTFTPNDDLKQ